MPEHRRARDEALEVLPRLDPLVEEVEQEAEPRAQSEAEHEAEPHVEGLLRLHGLWRGIRLVDDGDVLVLRTRDVLDLELADALRDLLVVIGEIHRLVHEDLEASGLLRGHGGVLLRHGEPVREALLQALRRAGVHLEAVAGPRELVVEELVRRRQT